MATPRRRARLLLDGGDREAARGAAPHARQASQAQRTLALNPQDLLNRGRPAQDGKHGKAWGTLTWRGVAGPVREIRGVLKPLWERCDAAPKLSGPKL